jgi:hypothetical protein
MFLAAFTCTKPPYFINEGRRDTKMQGWINKLNKCMNSQSDSITNLECYKFYKSVKSSPNWNKSLKEMNIKSAIIKNIEYIITRMNRKLEETFSIFPTDSTSASTTEIEQSLEDENMKDFFFIKMMIASAAYPQYFVKTRNSNPEDKVEKINKNVVGKNPHQSVWLSGPPTLPTKLQIKHLTKDLTFDDNRVPLMKWCKDKKNIIAEYPVPTDETEMYQKVVPIDVLRVLKLKNVGKEFTYLENYELK